MQLMENEFTMIATFTLTASLITSSIPIKWPKSSLFFFRSVYKRNQNLPNSILNEFCILNQTEPKNQLKTYLARLRSQKFGVKVLYMNELELYCNQITCEAIEGDIDAPFVAAFHINYSEKTFSLQLQPRDSSKLLKDPNTCMWMLHIN